MAKLINGNGNPAIYAAEDADLIASLAGNVTCIANVGNKYAATEEDATTIRLDDGVIITKEGRRIQLEAGESDTFYIPTGTSGQTNYYIIGYKLVQNADSTQVAEQFVQKMNSSSETITEDTFRSGATEVYVSVYRVTQVGFTIDSISGLLPELLDNASIKDNIDQINSDLPLTHSHREMSNGRTCAQIFGALATVLNSLTEQEKIGAKLVYGNTASVNRGVWSLKGMSAQGGIFSVTEATYSAGNTSYILGGTEASISTDSAQCYQVTEKVAASTVSGAVSNIASAKIESSDVIGSVSDTHYYELVW